MKKNVNVLIRVDCQYDFMPGGSLAVKNGDKIIKPLNKINGLFDYVVDTMDWHPANHRCFSEFNSGVKIGEKVKRNDVDNGEITVWPVHCVQNTHGALIHKELKGGDRIIFRKGIRKESHPFSGFSGVTLFGGEYISLTTFLEKIKATQVFIAGLATDYCVLETAIDACELTNCEVYVIVECCKGIASNMVKTYQKMMKAGVDVMSDLNQLTSFL